LFERENLGRDEPEHGRDAVPLVQEIDAVTRHARQFVAEVHVPGFLKDLDLGFRSNLVNESLQVVVFQRRSIHADQVAVDAHDGLIARGKVQVRGLLLVHEFEERIDPGHVLLPESS
jgi:hypothetical protein